MNIEFIEKKWEDELRRKFPGVVVRQNRRVAHEDSAEPLLDVFMIPDAQRRDFFQFMLNDVWKLEANEGFPGVYLMPHSVTATREHHPDIWRLAKTSASAKTARRALRTKARHSLSLAKKKLAAAH
ncbi:MAG TPA: hypothetical protein VKX17_15510 [Planctomycetota bacterium]|nr:hypothetical protein [Planctomycetota bacterium]